MKKLILKLFIASVFFVNQNQAYAASSEVTWANPDKYRDIHPGNENRKSFRKRTFKNLEKHFAKLSQKLPEQQTLKIDVTDVDLAGDTLAGGINRLRIIKEIYWPRINFSYQLVNADGSIIKSENVVLKDMNFMMHLSLKYRNAAFGYEKRMIDDWFFETFEELLVEK